MITPISSRSSSSGSVAAYGLAGWAARKARSTTPAPARSPAASSVLACAHDRRLLGEGPVREEPVVCVEGAQRGGRVSATERSARFVDSRELFANPVFVRSGDGTRARARARARGGRAGARRSAGDRARGAPVGGRRLGRRGLVVVRRGRGHPRAGGGAGATDEKVRSPSARPPDGPPPRSGRPRRSRQRRGHPEAPLPRST